MIDILLSVICMVIGYLLGSIPTGYLIAKSRGVDIQKVGSGNIGATNVLRTGNKLAAAMTLVLDGGKAALAVLLFGLWGEAAAQVAGLAAFLAHCFPVWLRFKGGKGVATFIGVALALHWPTGLVTCLAWLAGAAVTRISSVGALSAAAVGPVLMLAWGRHEALALSVVLAALVFWRHHANIRRLLRGEEPRIGRR